MKRFLLPLILLTTIGLRGQSPNYFNLVKNTNSGYLYSPMSLLKLSNGNNVVGGYLTDGMLVLNEGGMVAFDGSGNPVWSKTVQDYYPISMVENSGSIYSLLSNSHSSGFISKASNINGNISWTKSFTNANALFTGSIQSVAIFKEGTSSTLFYRRNDNNNTNYTLIAKVDASGNSTFSQRLDSLYPVKIRQMGSDYVLLGKKSWQMSDSVYYLLRLDAAMNTVWSASFTYPKNMYISGLNVQGNTIFLSGFDANYDGAAVVSAFDGNGNLGWSRAYYPGDASINQVYGQDVAVWNNKVYMMGYNTDASYTAYNSITTLDINGQLERNRIVQFNTGIYYVDFSWNTDSSIFTMGVLDDNPGNNYGMYEAQYKLDSDMGICLADSVALLDSVLMPIMSVAPTFVPVVEGITMATATTTLLSETPYIESVGTQIDSISLLTMPSCSSPCSGELLLYHSGYDQAPTITWTANAAGQTGEYIGSLCSDTYTAYQTDMFGCVDSASVILNYAKPIIPNICMVTVEDNSQYNMIFWDKTGYSSSDTFLVYRDTANNNYAWIGSVPYDSLSVFNDTVRSLYLANGDPNVSSWRYKIAVVDSCGTLSDMSPFHQTIYIQGDANGNFSWNQYQIEGQPVPVPQLSGYSCIRDDNSTDNWGVVVNLSASSVAFNDPNFSSFPNGRWRNKTLWSINCSDSTGKFSNNSIYGAINTSRSNVKSPSSVGIKSLKDNTDFYFAPNPAHDQLFVHADVNGTIHVAIYNMLGQEVINKAVSQKEFNIDISGLDAGTYFVQINSEKGKQTRKLIKN